jgi:hypothetical protein
VRTVRTITVRAPSSRTAVIEYAIVEPDPPGKIRRTLAAWLIRIAGRLVRMRVRKVDVWE